MSKRPPLMSDENIERIVDALACTWRAEVDMERAAMAVRIQYEEAYAKDAELIQRCVDALHGLCYGKMSMEDAADVAMDTIKSAEAHGFTPTI